MIELRTARCIASLSCTCKRLCCLGDMVYRRVAFFSGKLIPECRQHGESPFHKCRREPKHGTLTILIKSRASQREKNTDEKVSLERRERHKTAVSLT